MDKILQNSTHFFYCLLIFLYILTPLSLYAEGMEGKKIKNEMVTLNFADVDAPTIVKFISEITGKNFIYDERIKGKVTIITSSKISIEDAFNLFTSVMELKGFAIIPAGAAYKIIPSSMVRQSSAEVFKEEKTLQVNETYIARLIPLTFIQSHEIIPLLQPLVSRDGYMSSFSSRNAILVLDTALNIEKILNIIKLADVGPSAYPPEIVYLKYTQSDVLFQILKQGGIWKRGAQQKAQPQQEGLKFISDARLNAIIVFGHPEEQDEYKRLIALLDIPSPEANSRINVYYLENADASDIAKVLEGITKQPSQPSSAPGIPPQIQTSAEFTGRIAITPDKATNSLIIMASPQDYQNIVQVIQKLDKRPRQVFVEAMITEISINKALDLGAKWRAVGKKDGEPLAIGGVGTVDTTTIQNILTGMAGLTMGGLGNFIKVPVTKPDGTTTDLTVPGFAALFSLQEFQGAVDVLSTPHILTSDNKEAEIIVGENVPFLSKLERESATTNQPILQSIERKDVGIALKIKPQISEGNYVKLDIYQEISAIAPTAASEGLAITTKRSAKTSVVVKDKQTIVIGGLIQNKETKGTTKVPILGDIPLLGWLFKYSSTEKQKTNLLIYLTPKIVKDFDRLDEIKNITEEKFRDETSEKTGEDKKESKDGSLQ